MRWITALAGVAVALASTACEGTDQPADDCAPGTFWYDDVDGDGLGDPTARYTGCDPPTGYVDNPDDPDDACADAVTDACGVCGGSGARAWYADRDGDGLGDPGAGDVDCVQPAGYVANADDPEPDCATNDTDACGVCGGPGGEMGWADQDRDGLGDPEIALEMCERVEGFVTNAADLEPDCQTNDTDECGVCGGEGTRRFYADQDGDGMGDPEVFVDACLRPARFVDAAGDPEPRCATDDTDECGVCAGGGRDKDCVGVCFGGAFEDGCGRCVGGTTGRVPFEADANGNDVPDACDQCPRVPSARAVFQWTDVPAFGREGASGPYTFQAVLYENGDFAFHYADIEPFDATVTIGHQGEGGRHSASLGVDSDYPRENPVTYFRARDDGRVELDYSVRSDWLDVRASGRRLDFVDDDGYVEVPLDFEFPYDGATYDRVRVGANGVIALAGQAPGEENGPMGQPALGAFLAPFWDDLDPAAGGAVQVFAQGPECARDCTGMWGGVAVADDCGACVGGTSALDPRRVLDCNGVCFGEASIDACGQCSGGDTGIPPGDPAVCQSGPDLIVDREYLRSTLALDTVVADDPCLINERCVNGPGQRTVIRFGTRIANIGNDHLRLGRPSDDSPFWNFDQCHGHFHFLSYAGYDLYDPVSDRTLPVGAKSGFAVIDVGVYDPELAPNGCEGFGGGQQGISVGCHDTYSRGIQCQWIDITGVPDGIYDVVVTTNPDHIIPELDLSNNSARVRVRLQGGQLQVVADDALPE
ncbi:MAG: hypothetical protein H6705_20490 [Myxococcales bacterium]|nr:hypothetical protein [Myxococcales bacterium]